MNHSSARFAFLALSAWFAFFASIAVAQIPQTLNYQGFLTGATGTPLDAPAGVPMTFALFAATGPALYTEAQSVPVIKGVFNVVIGHVTPLTLKFDVPYFLEVTVNGETLAPRQPLASSAYALRSGCIPGDRVTCFDGPNGAPGANNCQSGTRTCNPQGTGWSACAGEVIPDPACGAVCCLAPQTCGGGGTPGQCGAPAGSCNSASDCPGTDTFCGFRTCTANLCGVNFTAAGTTLPPELQSTGDCKSLVCDGIGNTAANIDNSDLPSPMTCHVPLCIAGVPNYAVSADGSACTKPGNIPGTCTAGACN